MGRKVKVAFISRLPPAKCGIAEYTEMLLSETIKLEDLDVVVFAEYVESLPQHDKRHKSDPPTSIRSISCFRSDDLSQLRNCLRGESDVDIIHLQHEHKFLRDRKGLLEFLKYCKELGIKLVVTLHKVLHSLTSEREGLDFQRSLKDLADGVVVHSTLQEYELYV